MPQLRIPRQRFLTESVSRRIRQLGDILLIGERQRLGIHAIPQASRGGTVIEHMTEMAVTTGAQDLCADHAIAPVLMREDVLLSDGPEEAGPAGAGVELGARGEQG